MIILIALVCGMVFGAGLVISGMSNPERILNFLDFASIGSDRWDATLAIVFASAVGVMAIAYIIKSRTLVPVLSARYHMPTLTDVTPRLLTGAAIFGIGWGLSGICPGPSLAALTLTGVPGLETTDLTTFRTLTIFFASMLAGLWLGGLGSATTGVPESTDPSGSATSSTS